MKQSRNFRSDLIRYVSTALTVSLLVTLRVETPCSLHSGGSTTAAPSVTRVRSALPVRVVDDGVHLDLDQPLRIDEA